MLPSLSCLHGLVLLEHTDLGNDLLPLFRGRLDGRAAVLQQAVRPEGHRIRHVEGNSIGNDEGGLAAVTHLAGLRSGRMDSLETLELKLLSLNLDFCNLIQRQVMSAT